MTKPAAFMALRAVWCDVWDLVAGTGFEPVDLQVMSLTSYRAAPPRARVSAGMCNAGKVVIVEGEWFILFLCRSGGDRLSRVLRHSTIGAGVFNGRVRDGIGFWAHRSNHQTGAGTGCVRQALCWSCCCFRPVRLFGGHGSWKRSSSIERLVLVSSTRHRACTPSLSTWWSSTALKGVLVFEVGFPLRCLQRLSRPYVATLHCGWRHNSSTRGMFIPVLSY